MNDEQVRGGADPSTAAENRREISASAQPPVCRQHRNGSGRDLGAALAATRGEDGAAGAGAHPRAEAVVLGPAAVVRLESPLAHDGLLSFSLLRDRTRGP